MLPELAALALGTFLSEDLACLSAGVLVAQGKLPLAAATAACVLGIFAGDLLLFAAGRTFGRRALEWKWIARFVSREQAERASRWISARGLRVVLLSRFTPGLRLPTYFAAGVLRTSLARFSIYLLLAATLWTPLLVASTGALGRSAPAGLAGAVGAAAAIGALSRAAASRSLRRRIAGWWGRVTRWEFWPWWLAYLPVFAYIGALALRHRSLTRFAAANPGIPLGGFAGESKSRILANLPAAMLPKHRLIAAGPGAAAEARRFLEDEGLAFPVVLKPDVGERGRGVAVARTDGDLERYFAAAPGAVIVQEYVGGLEYGIYYSRRPGEDRGRIFSITEKRFPEIAGDGESTVEELILNDRRAVCLSGLYLEKCGRRPDEILAAGERLQLVEIGSHCRGAVFLDGRRLRTAELEAAADRAARHFAGFHLGRFDVRAPSEQDFRQGRFRILELNGVTAEPAHIYDPAVPIVDAYRALFTQWRLAFEIGAATGAAAPGAGALLRAAFGR